MLEVGARRAGNSTDDTLAVRRTYAAHTGVAVVGTGRPVVGLVAMPANTMDGSVVESSCEDVG